MWTDGSIIRYSSLVTSHPSLAALPSALATVQSTAPGIEPLHARASTQGTHGGNPVWGFVVHDRFVSICMVLGPGPCKEDSSEANASGVCDAVYPSAKHTSVLMGNGNRTRCVLEYACLLGISPVVKRVVEGRKGHCGPGERNICTPTPHI